MMAVIYPQGLKLHSSAPKNNLRLDIYSLSNVDILVNTDGTQEGMPCPTELTNSISNTNLFTLEEKQLIESIPLIYGRIMTNVNTGNIEKPGETHIFRDKAGNGYDVYGLHMDPVSHIYEFKLVQIMHGGHHGVYLGTYNGLSVDMLGDHCEQWMCFSNGLAINEWLRWEMSGKLIVWVKFKDPYDYLKYSQTGLGS